ncbi:carboxymuconolactone decarboxylase family protein [Sulfobacillus harzensis]|uniref:Carboxymuconolactone decarboxylase family protein n=1 Tax=Sulfobacillus harzensis TaxID=2729629 RepID=A0A7Y0Q595_9FIRM|nr:carboxymuconolactone decarboxylase family protein [Sulfobacillus harzensis]NMP24856.1 carboxymuconolactone decarboxylase family protein [Sulfobacillus harzensis]
MSENLDGSLRLDWSTVLPEARDAMVQLESVAHHAGIPREILELVKIRVSQINGCAYCLDMHTKEARNAGEREQRIYALSAWRDAPFYSPRERAALQWAEAVTKISEGVSDTVYQALEEQFSPREIAALTAGVIAINSWNRWAISLKAEQPGTYRPDLAR